MRDQLKKRINNCIDRNERRIKKIENFFRLFEIIVLTVTLVVSIISLRCISTKQLHIEQSQLKIEKAMADPIIDCKVEYNEDETKIEEIDITVDKNPANDLNISVIPLYSIYVLFYEGYSKKKKKMISVPSTGSIVIPINSFIKDDLYTIQHSANIGKICTLYPLRINEKYFDVFSNTNIDYSELSGKCIISTVELAYFIEITYTDILENEIREIYYCKPNYSISFDNKYNVSSYLSSTNFYRISEGDKLYDLYNKNKNEECVTYNATSFANENEITRLKEAIEEAIDKGQYYLIS